jgi:hypothetical protein
MIIIKEKSRQNESAPTISQLASGFTSVKSLATRIYKSIQNDILKDSSKFKGPQEVPYYAARNMIAAIIIGVLENEPFIRTFFYLENPVKTSFKNTGNL